MKRYRYFFNIGDYIIPVVVEGFNELNAWYIAVHKLDAYYHEQFKSHVWGKDKYNDGSEFPKGTIVYEIIG
jgi:hypothetical protein